MPMHSGLDCWINAFCVCDFIKNGKLAFQIPEKPLLHNSILVTNGPYKWNQNHLGTIIGISGGESWGQEGKGLEESLNSHCVCLKDANSREGNCFQKSH